MISSISLLFRYFMVSVKAQMQYKISFILQTAGHFLVTGGDFIGIWVLFSRFEVIKGWELPEVAFFYGLVNVSFSVADALSTGFDRFSVMVKDGGFDRYLVRPRSTVLQLCGYEFTLRRVGRFAQGLFVLCWSIYALELSLDLYKLALLMFAIVGGASLFFGLFVIQATISFWTTESLEVMNMVTYGGVEATSYPLSIYKKWFRGIFIFFIPLACVTYFPALAIMGKEDPLGSSFVFQSVAPLMGIVFLMLSFQFWKIGVRHYLSTGS